MPASAGFVLMRPVRLPSPRASRTTRLPSVNLGHRWTNEKRGVDHPVAMYRRLDAFDPKRDWLSALLLGLAALAVPLSVAIRSFLLWLQS